MLLLFFTCWWLHTSETIIMNSMCSLQTYSWTNITVIYQNVLKLYIYIYYVSLSTSFFFLHHCDWLLSMWFNYYSYYMSNKQLQYQYQYRPASLSIDPAFKARACTDCEYIECTTAIIIIVILVRSLFLVY